MGKLIDGIMALLVLCVLIVAILIVGVIHLLALLLNGLFSLVTIEEPEPQCEQCRKLWEGCSCDSENKKECFVPNNEGNEE